MVGDTPETDILGAINAGLAATVLVTGDQAAAAGSNIDTASAIGHSQDRSHTVMCAVPSNHAGTLKWDFQVNHKSSLNSFGHSVSAKANGFDSTAVCSNHNSIGGSKNGLNSKALCKCSCVENGTADLGVGQNGLVSDYPKPAKMKQADAVMHLANTAASLLVQSQEGCVEREFNAAVPDAGKTALYDRHENGDGGRCPGIFGSGELLNGSSSSSTTPCCGQSLGPGSVGRLAPPADFVVNSVLDLPKILPLLNNNNRL